MQENHLWDIIRESKCLCKLNHRVDQSWLAAPSINSIQFLMDSTSKLVRCSQQTDSLQGLLFTLMHWLLETQRESIPFVPNSIHFQWRCFSTVKLLSFHYFLILLNKPGKSCKYNRENKRRKHIFLWSICNVIPHHLWRF